MLASRQEYPYLFAGQFSKQTFLDSNFHREWASLSLLRACTLARPHIRLIAWVRSSSSNVYNVCIRCTLNDNCPCTVRIHKPLQGYSVLHRVRILRAEMSILESCPQRLTDCYGDGGGCHPVSSGYEPNVGQVSSGIL